jgi:hypothetical protein
MAAAGRRRTAAPRAEAPRAEADGGASAPGRPSGTPAAAESPATSAPCDVPILMGNLLAAVAALRHNAHLSDQRSYELMNTVIWRLGKVKKSCKYEIWLLK